MVLHGAKWKKKQAFWFDKILFEMYPVMPPSLPQYPRKGDTVESNKNHLQSLYFQYFQQKKSWKRNLPQKLETKFVLKRCTFDPQSVSFAMQNFND